MGGLGSKRGGQSTTDVASVHNPLDDFGVYQEGPRKTLREMSLGEGSVMFDSLDDS
jgi:hypothetical protein